MAKIKYSTETLFPRFSETVLAELDPRFSRTVATLAPSEKPLPFGLVLTKNKDGQYAPFSVSGVSSQSDGETETKAENEACAVLIAPLDASKDSQTGLILRGYAILNGENLVFDESVSDKKAAFSQLEKATFIIETIAEAEDVSE